MIFTLNKCRACVQTCYKLVSCKCPFLEPHLNKRCLNTPRCPIKISIEPTSNLRAGSHWVPRSQVPLILANPNMEANSHLLSLKKLSNMVKRPISRTLIFNAKYLWDLWILLLSRWTRFNCLDFRFSLKHKDSDIWRASFSNLLWGPWTQHINWVLLYIELGLAFLLDPSINT
jgi:hypothetical protein